MPYPPNSNFPNRNGFPNETNENLPDNWIRVGELFNSLDLRDRPKSKPKSKDRKHVGQDYLEAVLDIMRNMLPSHTFRKIHALALPKSGGRANANRLEKMKLEEMTPVQLRQVAESEVRESFLRVNQWYNSAKESGRAVENYVNAARFIMDEFHDRGLDYDDKLPVARVANRLHKSIEDAVVTRENLKDLPEEVMIVPDFVSVVGSSVRSDDPADVDILYRADINEKGDFIISWENVYLAMRNSLKTIMPELDMHEIFNPQGSREEQWLPVYNLVLRKSRNDLRMVKDQITNQITPHEENQQILTTPPGTIESFDTGAPAMQDWETYLNDIPPEGIWADIGCGSNKAKDFIGVDKELYPGVDMKADLTSGIPFADETCSVIRANHVVEHMPDFDKMMSDVARVLIDKGLCIMTMPSTDGAGAEAHPDHKIFMNKEQFESAIDNLGFFEPVLIKERNRENSGVQCVDIDAVLRRKERYLVPNSMDGVLNTQPFKWIESGVQKVEKIAPLASFLPMKMEMAGYTESFEVKDLTKWAEDKYPVDIEGKLNGNRSIISKKGNKVELWYEGQMGKNKIGKMPEIEDFLKKIPEDFVLDMDLALLRDGKRVPRGDDMVFNKEDLDLKPDESVIITLFDILYRGKDISKEPWSERRKELEDFYSKHFKGNKHFAITQTRIVQSEKGLQTATRWAFSFPMSEGLVAKQVDSPYEQGGSNYWYKLKKVAELKLIVLSKKITNAGAYVYEAGLLPSPDKKLNAHETELDGKKYISMGNTLASKVLANVGEILTIQLLELIPDYEKETLAWVGPRVQDVDDTRKEPYSVEQSLDITDRAQLLQKHLRSIVPSSDPHCSKCFSGLAFVGSSPGKTEASRGDPLVGSSGETFNDAYLKPLGLRRDQVFITNAVPKLLLDDDGNVREPSDEEVSEWHEWLFNELDKADAKVVVALGRTAKKALHGEADIVMPHPMAIRRFGDSGEVSRKIKHIKQKLAGVKKDTIGPGDVHIDSTNWKTPKQTVPRLSGSNAPEIISEVLQPNKDWRKPESFRQLAKVDDEGEGETRTDASKNFWQKNWQNLYPLTGKGDFVYQHHWRGMDENEVKLSEEELLKTNHSVHGDLRFTAHDGSGLWGFTVFIGSAEDNQKDKLINLPSDDNLQGAFKLEQPKEWLTIARGKPHIATPGEPGSTSQAYSKFFEEDHGTYEIGVWKQHVVEIFLHGSKLKGRFLIEYAPVGGKHVWLIDRPDGKDHAQL